MTNTTPIPPRQARVLGLIVAACGVVVLCTPSVAAARPYTVVSCDSAGLFGYNSAAWAPYGNAGSAYASCPSGGGSTAGVSNRLIGGTYSGYNHSVHAFRAPPGTTITNLRWAGRAARDNCKWGTYIRALPSDAAIAGLPHNQYCDATGFDNRGWPLPFAVPGGTTQLEQLVICAAPQCFPGGTIHSHVLEVTVDDPIPPSISLDGPMASGQWVSGRAATRYVVVAAPDNAGVRDINASVGAQSASRSRIHATSPRQAVLGPDEAIEGPDRGPR